MYNGDFELYDTCPTFPSFPGSNQLETCLGWRIPTAGTSDYFNTCATGTQVGLPSNSFGYQIPYSGNAYCGTFVEYAEPPFVSVKQWYVEYIQSQLLMPLQAGYEYEFSCYIVLSDIARDYAFWKFGAYFSSSAITKSDDKPLNVIPQVLNNSNNFITDTLNWVEVKGRFIARGAEEFVTIGFYLDTLAPDSLVQVPYSAIEPRLTGAYYYIDGCSLKETGEVQNASNVFTPNGDGQNDLFSIAGLQRDEKVVVFDRWGIQVAEFSGENSGWDGRTTAGENCVDGIYYYILQRKEEKESLKGFVQLVR